MIVSHLQAGLRFSLAVVVLVGACLQSSRADEGQPSFTNEVMAVLSKAGCNAGTCHGNQNGKGGFKLSLRGQDPAADFLAITRDQFGRRINAFDPEQSLILQKPTMQVAHEGGLRLKHTSRGYALLHRWIAAGASPDTSGYARLESIDVEPREQVLVEPQAEVRIRVRARFSGDANNGSSARDVTDLSVFEPSSTIVIVTPEGLVRFKEFGEATVIVRYLNLQVPVRLAYIPARPDIVWSDTPSVNYIDEHIFGKLRSLRINPSELSSDSEFIRRAYLDTLGILPTADESRRFLADTTADKREKLIETLLARPEFAEFWAMKWSDLLKNEEKVIDPTGTKLFHEWIRDSFAANKPLDQFARELVAARGSTYKNPPANYYRANRDAVSRSEATAQVFLGIRLGCAKCHNHPFDRWTQDDYYRWTALFARVDYKIVENNRPDDNDKHQFDGEQIVEIAEKGEVENPLTRSPASPRFLGGAELPQETGNDRLTPLADWLASPENELFVRSQANRIWYHLLGRGLVEPIDDFRATNPAVNPALLDALSKDLIEHRFDVRHLVRTIMRSRTYQLASQPNATNTSDEVNFSRAIVKRLSAEQLLDGLTQVIGGSHEVFGSEAGQRAGQAAGVGAFKRREKGDRRRQPASDAEKFLKLFGKPPRLLTCECERSTDSTLAQAFQLLSGPTLQKMLSASDNRLARLLATHESPLEIIDEVYWSALARRPSDDERAALVAYIEQAPNWRAGLEDVVWGVVNSKEFLLRR